MGMATQLVLHSLVPDALRRLRANPEATTLAYMTGEHAGPSACHVRPFCRRRSDWVGFMQGITTV
jgi:hypothetical protein